MQVVIRERAQSGHVTQRCHNSPRWNGVTECGWRHAPETHRGLCENLKKVRELSTRRQMRRFDFWSLQTRGELAPYGARWGETNLCALWGPLEMGIKWIEDCVSPPCVKTFNSKLIKRFCTWTRSCYMFSNFEIPMFFIYSIVINIRYPFHPFRTWPYSCIWLCNTEIEPWSPGPLANTLLIRPMAQLLLLSSHKPKQDNQQSHQLQVLYQSCPSCWITLKRIKGPTLPGIVC